jgi:ketosteroid isomerase-like protein
MRSAVLFLAALGLTVAACASPNLAADEQAIRDADARWLKAAQARDAAGEGAVFADDGIAYRDGGQVTGPAAVQAYAAKQYAENPKGSVSWTTDDIEVAASGDLAIQRGAYRNTGYGANGDREMNGRFVTVWKKVNGEWKATADIGDPRPASPLASEVASAADAVKADPKHYTVEFENESVRVLRIRYAPGETSVMHMHPASCAVFLGDQRFTFTTPDGKVQDNPTRAGQVTCGDADIHNPQNAGTNRAEVILVEFKNRQTFKP